MSDADFVPDDADLVRCCKATQIDNGRPTGAAFIKRPEEQAISVNWLSRADGSSETEKLRATVAMLQMTVRPSYLLAMLLAGHVRSIHASPPLDVLHQPLEKNPAHCGIINVPDSSPKSLNSVNLALAAAVTTCVTRAELDRGGP